jgi:IK cytokine
MEESIFPDVGEYDFTATKATSAGATSSGRPKKYFEKDKDDAMEVETDKDIHKAAKEFVKSVGKKYSNVKVIGPPPDDSSGQLPAGWFAGEVDTSAKKSTVDSTSGLYEVVSSSKKDKVGFGGFDDDHYAECYPGGLEEMDATVNSDDEADFTKMDLGNRKGPVKRWDFDTEEDYGHYQSSREALPKAAFQYGVKMNDGRKTRRQGVKNDKAKLNREWQQISQILQKRKSKDLES